MLARHTKLRIFRTCGFSLKKIRIFHKEHYLRIGQLKTRGEVDGVIKEFTAAHPRSSNKAA
jgi:hypothetical protein